MFFWDSLVLQPVSITINASIKIETDLIVDFELVKDQKIEGSTEKLSFSQYDQIRHYFQF